MAFTTSHLFDTVFGDKRVSIQQVTFDAAEGTVVTRLPKLDFALVSMRKQASFVASGNTSQTYVNYVINAGTTGTAINGTIGFSGCVANNIAYVVSFGAS